MWLFLARTARARESEITRTYRVHRRVRARVVSSQLLGVDSGDKLLGRSYPPGVGDEVGPPRVVDGMNADMGHAHAREQMQAEDWIKRAVMLRYIKGRWATQPILVEA